MVIHFPSGMETLLLTGYIMFSILLNILALFISSFYRKKFNQPAPRIGFLISIMLAVIFIVFLYVPFKGDLYLQTISVISLLGSGSASIYSILYLFFTMRRVRK